jgi:membrane-bound metal-dependent hydrolase YbcI (DUF457 family)
MFVTIFYTHSFLTSLFFTIVVETTLLYVLLRFIIRQPDLSSFKIIATGFFANFMTVPYVWFIFPTIIDWSRNTSLLYSEPFVFLVEAVIYRIYLKTSMRTALFVSLVCNAASYFIGPILRAHGIWVYW